MNLPRVDKSFTGVFKIVILRTDKPLSHFQESDEELPGMATLETLYTYS